MPKFILKPLVEIVLPIVIAFSPLYVLMFMVSELLDDRIDAIDARLKSEITASEDGLSDDIADTRDEVSETRKDIKDTGSRIEEVERSQYKLDGAFDILNQQLGAGAPESSP